MHATVSWKDAEELKAESQEAAVFALLRCSKCDAAARAASLHR